MATLDFGLELYDDCSWIYGNRRGPQLIGSGFTVQPCRWPQATTLIEKETVPHWRSFIRGVIKCRFSKMVTPLFGLAALTRWVNNGMRCKGRVMRLEKASYGSLSGTGERLTAQ